MRVLWLCNIMLPAIAQELKLPYSNREGWLTGIYERIRREKEAAVKTGGIREMSEREMDGREGKSSGIELGICFPAEEMPSGNSGQTGKTEELHPKKFRPEMFRLEKDGVVFYGFGENLAAPEIYDDRIEEYLKEILQDFRPDIVHIFGTEFPHTLAMVRVFGRPERTLIGIQGLCFACAEAYMADLPERVICRRTFRDRLRKDSILQQQEKFRVRGEREKEVLRMTGHITGRTEFDRRETEKINGRADYHFMNETMRPVFYSGRWKAEECMPYSIFLSQGDYPLKGFHYMLRALPEILAHYPDACVYVAGNSVIGATGRNGKDSIKSRIKLSSYGKYLLELIRTLGLEGHVRMLGKLSDVGMKEQMLKSSVFVCPSSLENSPNSLGEAMLLGVPAVAADTGGIPSMLENGKEGLLYEAGNVKMLAECVLQTWEEKEKTAQRTEAARSRALKAHDGNRNFERLLAIYKEILQ